MYTNKFCTKAFQLVLSILLTTLNILYSQNLYCDSLKLLLKNEKADTTKIKLFGKLGEQYLKSGNFSEAESWYLHMLNMAKQQQNTKHVGIARLGLGSVYRNTSRPQQAEESYLEAIKLFRDIAFNKGVASALNNIGNLYKELGQYKKANEVNFQSLAMKAKSKDTLGIALSYQNIGNVYSFSGDYLLARKFSAKALFLYKCLKDEYGIGQTLNNFGNIYRKQGNYPEALKFYYESLLYKEKEGNKSAIARNLSNIGETYFETGNFREAEEHLLRAMRLANENRDWLTLGNAANNLGMLYLKINKADKALELFKQSLAVKIKRKDIFGQTNSLNNIANVYLNKGQFMAADSCFLATEKLINTTGESERLGIIYNNRAIICFQYKKYFESKQLLKKSEAIALRNNAHQDLFNCYLWMYKTDSALGDLKGACENYNNYMKRADSLINRDKIKHVYEAKIQYQYNKRNLTDSLQQTEKDLVEKAKHTAELETQRNRTIFIFSGLILLLFFCVYIWAAYRKSKKLNLKIAKQKEIIEEKHREVIDSITYARRIQRALITNEHYLRKNIERLKS